MKQKKTRLHAWLTDCSGATAIEYGFIVLLIAIVIVASITTIGEHVTAMIESVIEGFSSGD